MSTADMPAVPHQDLINRLASLYGIQTTFTAQDGENQTVNHDTVLKILRVLGADLPDDQDKRLKPKRIRRALGTRRDEIWSQQLPDTSVIRAERGGTVQVTARVGEHPRAWVDAGGQRIELAPVPSCVAPFSTRMVESRRLQHYEFQVPADLPTGEHALFVEPVHRGYHAELQPHRLLVVPEKLTAIDAYETTPGWGLSVQLYSVRSSASWGIGDFHDLADLARIAADRGADFVLTNPLHASEPDTPILDSPYSPVSRSFLNPLYIRVEDIPEYHNLSQDQKQHIQAIADKQRQANSSPDLLDRNSSYAAKLEALELIFAEWRTSTNSVERKEEYRAFCVERGPLLRDFATWSAMRTQVNNRDAMWKYPKLAKDGVTTRKAQASMDEDIEFYQWLQFICTQQLAAAQQAAVESGMRTGIMVDLAVGADRHTADAWMLPESLVEPFSVGAPPDMYNQLGQDWSQHPWNPDVLAATGYEAFRLMLRAVFTGVGAVRIDHILGLFRLWWVPEDGSPTDGAYVTYDEQAMLGVLVDEAERAGVLIVGEDLGTVDANVATELASRKILGTSIMWFENYDGVPHDPSSYRRLCLSAVNTHDLPPTAGYVEGVHIQLREDLDLLTADAAEERAKFQREIHGFLDTVVNEGYLDASVVPEEPGSGEKITFSLEQLEDIIVALYRWTAERAPSRLHAVALVDAVTDRRIQNQPGTTQDQYANWCQPLTGGDGNVVLIDQLSDHGFFNRLTGAVNEALRR